MAKTIIGTILIILGIGALFGISLWNFIIAFILVIIGIRIIAGKGHRYWNMKSSESTTGENYINEVNIFSTVDKKIKSDDFRGGKVVIIFSTGKVDLSQVKTKLESIDLEIVVMFGKCELIVPKGWKINSKGTSILGGYNTKVEAENITATLNVKGVVVLGEIKILN